MGFTLWVARNEAKRGMCSVFLNEPRWNATYEGVEQDPHRGVFIRWNGAWTPANGSDHLCDLDHEKAKAMFGVYLHKREKVDVTFEGQSIGDIVREGVGVMVR